MGTQSNTLSPANRAREIIGGLPSDALRLLRSLDLSGTRLDLAILVALTVLAAVPRLVALADIPPGLHGDEAWTGLDARRVLNEGWIGPYVVSALGQPTGPLYFAAPIVAIFGDTVFAVRLSMALLAIVTIPVAYLTFRVMSGRTLATFAAIFLALSLWHLHYSRIGFMVISWPLVELVTLLFLFLGVKSGRWLFFGLAGLAFGAGIYTYNAYPVFALPFGLVVVWLAWRNRGHDRVGFAARVALMLALAFLAALPMILYAADSDNSYLSHHRGLSILETDEWEVGGLLDRADILFDATGDYLSAVFWSGAPDGADGAGHQAMVDRVSLALLVVGVGILLWRWRQPGLVAVLLMVALIPSATIITTNGTFRQSLGMVPFLAVLAAAPLALWWDGAKGLSLPWRNASYAAIAVIVASVGYLNLNSYFNEFPDTPIARFVFGEPLTEASLYMHDLAGDPYVFFYSGRWSFDYETRRFLAADREGEDRSSEFGTFSLEPDRAGDVVYVFLDPYLDQADEVERLFPGGTRFDSGDDDGSVQFRAYFLPQAGRFDERGGTPAPGAATPGPSATQVVRPTATTGPGAEQRDAVRQQDLEAIQEALAEYLDENGSYPDTGGGVQSLCVFAELDAACALRDFLGALPQDPLGNGPNDGYWYQSTGAEFTVYALRESAQLPECPEQPAHLARFASLLCVQGP